MATSRASKLPIPVNNDTKRVTRASRKVDKTPSVISVAKDKKSELSSLLKTTFQTVQTLNYEVMQKNNKVVALEKELSNSRVLMESLSMKCQRMEEAQVKMRDQEEVINSLQSELSNMEELKAKVSKHQALEVLLFQTRS